MHLAPWSGAKSIKLLVLNGSQKLIKIGQDHRSLVSRKICLPQAWLAPWNVMRTSKTPFPTPTVSQPSVGQVWPAQRTQVHVQVDDFKEPHRGKPAAAVGRGDRGRQAGPGGTGTWGRLVGLPSHRTWSEPVGTDTGVRRREAAGWREDTLCLEEPVGHRNCFLDSRSVVCRGQQRKHHLGTQ